MSPIQYISDAAVDEKMDFALRMLLTTCFTKHADQVFKQRRFFNAPPAHRWTILHFDQLIAHVAAHELTVRTADRDLQVAGIAEVCVHPIARGRGLVGEMLKQAHEFFREQRFPFAALCGETAIYQSSGYIEVKNMTYLCGGELLVVPDAMVRQLGDEPWPNAEVFLAGDLF